MIVMLLRFFGLCSWGCEYSDLFLGCVLQDMRTTLSEGIGPRV